MHEIIVNLTSKYCNSLVSAAQWLKSSSVESLAIKEIRFWLQCSDFCDGWRCGDEEDRVEDKVEKGVVDSDGEGG